MCGRYELHSNPAAIALAFGLAHPPEVHPRYNIAPMTDVPIVRVNATGERELVRMRWGLVPRWAKDTVDRQPDDQRARRDDRRQAVVPHGLSAPSLPHSGRRILRMGGRGERRAIARKQPLHIGMKDGSLFAIAGLYERWLSRRRRRARHLHDRHDAGEQPARGRPRSDADDRRARGLRRAGSTRRNADVADLIAPYPSEAMAYYPVSPRVNNVRNDDAPLIERTEPMAADAEPEHEAPHPPEQESLF